MVHIRRHETGWTIAGAIAGAITGAKIGATIGITMGGLLVAACTTPPDDPGSKEHVPEEPCPPAHARPCPDNPQEECCEAHDIYGYSLSRLLPGPSERVRDKRPSEVQPK